MRIVDCLPPSKARTITVYASSSSAVDQKFKRAAYDLGLKIATAGWRQVNGGGSAGLMGAATDGAIAGNGRVDSVILDIFTDKNMHSQLENVMVSPNMPDRKKGLYDVADAIIALPGGLGTLEEVSEVLSWRQLKFHFKPIIFVNTAGFYDPLLSFLENSVKLGFVAESFSSVLISCDTPEEAVTKVKSLFEAPVDFIVTKNGIHADWAKNENNSKDTTEKMS